MKKVAPTLDSDMRDECDFSKGVRGKDAQKYAEGTNIVMLDPDVAAVFPTSAAVNEALRTLIRLMQQSQELPA
jgi:hypothetical protein